MCYLRVGQYTNNTNIVESNHEMMNVVVILNTEILQNIDNHEWNNSKLIYT